MKAWQSISESVETRITIRHSKFIAYLAPADDQTQAAAIVAQRNQEYADATHNCHAWVLGFNRELTHCSDAGEPAGTAGKPILNSLLSAGLTNTVAVVTRYYGGIKLGVRGLIDAYGQSVAAALENACLVDAIPMCELRVISDYPDAENLHKITHKLGGIILSANYDSQVETNLKIPRDNAIQLLDFLDGRRRQSGLIYQLKEQ